MWKNKISHVKRHGISVCSIHLARYTIQPWDSKVSMNGFKKKLQEPEFNLNPQEAELFQLIKRAIQKLSHLTSEGVTISLKSNEVLSKFQLSSNLVDSLIQKFGDDWKSALGFFNWANSHPSYKHTTYAYNRMIDLVGKMKKFDAMWNLLYESYSTRSLSLDTVAKAMRRLAGARQWKETISLFDKLETLGLERSVETVNVLLDALCKEGKVNYAREAFLVLKSHIRPNEHTFNILLHGWCKVRNIEEAIRQIEEMKQHGLKPSVITYSTIVNACCHQGNFSEVYKILDFMVSQGCPPNVITYTTIMNSLAKSGKIDEALNIIQRMKDTRCAPDTLFYNSLLHMLGKAGRWNEAWSIFEVEMELNGVPHSLSTYNTMVTISCRHGIVESALSILRKMEISNCKPDLWSYRPILRLCLRKRDLNNQVWLLLDEIINKHGISLDLDTYTLLIHGFCKCGDFNSGLSIFEKMVSHDIHPSSITCELLLNEAEREGRVDVVQLIKDFMDQKEEIILPNQVEVSVSAN
ncbi:Pentatricopeptide repeat-containing protein [Rhynchospora pubera]|uniref:Pentatricopeptide repeat-containing protein n=1 Tax=Rhynchospora pubera TaxID=906938 RepID=A0AAV8FEA8_9POAL|nr:Pentatricopeptide repeat-containing protein [Rhynchospora pubera]